MRVKRLRHAWVLGAVAAAFWCINDANADMFTFGAITANNVLDVDTAEAQLTVDVTDYTVEWNGADKPGIAVLFKFINIGPNASSITDVYFDDGSLLKLSALWDRSEKPVPAADPGHIGVDFDVLATPGNLPSGNAASPPFEASTGFSADSGPPVQPNGVNPDEWLGIVYTLQGGQTFLDVLSELGDGTLRIGIHVQGFDGEGSESLVNIIPAPGAGLLGLIGLTSVGWMRRRA